MKLTFIPSDRDWLPRSLEWAILIANAASLCFSCPTTKINEWMKEEEEE